MNKVTMESCVGWWVKATEDERWNFIVAIRGERVCKEVGYVYPLDRRLPEEESEGD